MEKQDTKLATELIHELKVTSKRWFIAFLVVLGLWFATIGTFIWYISLPIEESTSTEISQDSEDNGSNQIVGGDLIGKTESSSNENNPKG